MLTPKFSHVSIADDFEEGVVAAKKRDFATVLVNSHFGLGRLYAQGHGGLPQDYKIAINWFTLAAKQGHVKAQFVVGAMYAHGKGVAQDYKTAVNWYTLAAEQGHAKAQNNLGLMYDEGKGVAQDYKTAVKWYTLAAEQDNVLAQFNLGTMYDEGLGVAQDYVKAYMWYNIAAISVISTNAAAKRDIVAKKMTPDQIEKAQEAEENFWIKQNFKNCD